MRRVVLTNLPGLNYFIGTFDLENYATWWKSAPLPGDVADIEHALWVGGPMHLCLARMTDGTWSIFLSFDYGVNWQLVKNSAVEIMDIELVTFTWVLYSDANGDWWESFNSGLTWNKVCAAGPVGRAFFVLHKGTESRIFCHDGRYISLSIDIARHWETVCDLNSVTIDGDSYSEESTYTGTRMPAIAGANGTILASNGPYMARSLDNGDSFASNHSWDNVYAGDAELVLDYDNNTVHSCFPPVDLVELNRRYFLISDIVISSIDGPLGGDVTFVVLAKDVTEKPSTTIYKPIVVLDKEDNVFKSNGSTFPRTAIFTFPVYVPGSNDDFLNVDEINTISDLSLVYSGTKTEQLTVYSSSDIERYKKAILVKYDKKDVLMNRVYKTFSGKVMHGDLEGDEYFNFWFRYIYQQATSLGEIELSSYQLLTVGGTTWDRLLFSAMSDVDDDGNPVVGLKYSIDGGLTYHDIDLSTINIYSGNVDEEPDTGGGAFTHLDYSNLVWVCGECNNTGHWDYETGERIQMLSYDVDAIFLAEGNKPYNLSARIVKDNYLSYDLSAIINTIRTEDYSLAAYIQKPRSRPYNLSARMERIGSVSYDLNAAMSRRYDISYDLDAYCSVGLRYQYYLYAHVQGPKSQFYTLDAIITDSQADEMGVAFERRIPQAWNLIFKPLPKPIYDSRKNPETD